MFTPTKWPTRILLETSRLLGMEATKVQEMGHQLDHRTINICKVVEGNRILLKVPSK